MRRNKAVGSSLLTPVVFSLGDPHGVGPEVLLKTLKKGLRTLSIQPILFGPPEYLRRLSADLGLELDWGKVQMISTGEYCYPPRWGQIDRQAGHMALESLRAATLFCRDQGFPLLVTSPVHKTALHLAGFKNPGQSEFVASFFGTKDPAMAFFSRQMNVVLVTAHVAFDRVSQELSVERVVQKSVLFYEALRSLGHPDPKLALSGLNPHASEEGLFGTEEERILKPAIEQLSQQCGVESVSGPFPPDTVFLRALRGEFDGVVALYHDQGLIPLKLLAFDTAVHTTLGLPIVRTSPDHGTAFDIAGKGSADPGSLFSALEVGLKLIARRS